MPPCSRLSQKGVELLLVADRGGRRAAVVVARHDHRLIRKGAELPLDGIEHDLPRSAGQVGPSDGLHKQGVAGEGVTVGIKNDAARGMTGGVDDPESDPADGDAIAVPYRLIGGGDCFAQNILSIAAGVETSMSASSSWMMISAPVFVLMSTLPPV